MEKLKQNTQRAKENVGRLASEEREMINNLLATVDEKIKTRRSRHSENLDMKRSIVKTRNMSHTDKLASHRTLEVHKQEERHKKHEERERTNTVRLRRIYKESYNAWTDFKEERREYYRENCNRKGDNS